MLDILIPLKANLLISRTSFLPLFFIQHPSCPSSIRANAFYLPLMLSNIRIGFWQCWYSAVSQYSFKGVTWNVQEAPDTCWEHQWDSVLHGTKDFLHTIHSNPGIITLGVLLLLYFHEVEKHKHFSAILSIWMPERTGPCSCYACNSSSINNFCEHILSIFIITNID